MEKIFEGRANSMAEFVDTSLSPSYRTSQVNSLLSFAILLLYLVTFSAPVLAQFPSQGAQPSPVQINVMQEEGLKMMKPLIDEVFSNSDTDNSDSLNKDELIEFTLELYKAQLKFMADRGIVVPHPSETELSRLREEMEQRLDEAFKRNDSDESGDISLEEVLEAMSGGNLSGEDGEEDFEATTDGYDSNSSAASQESAIPQTAQFPPHGAQPSPELIEAMQEYANKRMKPIIESAFDNSDADDSDSLDKDEMLEFSVEFVKGQVKAMTESMTERGLDVLQLSEDELSQMKEIVKQGLNEQFKRTDFDGSGDISQEEIFKAMLDFAYSGEEEEPASSSVEEDTNVSGDFNESLIETR